MGKLKVHPVNQGGINKKHQVDLPLNSKRDACFLKTVSISNTVPRPDLQNPLQTF